MMSQMIRAYPTPISERTCTDGSRRARWRLVRSLLQGRKGLRLGHSDLIVVEAAPERE